MLYTVEIDFNNPGEEPAWQTWYHNNLPVLLTVPGFSTAQRFEKVGETGFRYLAAYTLSGPGVFESDAYVAVGGGGRSTVTWRQWMNRTRNVYAGIDWVPPVTEEGRLVLTTREPAELDLPDTLFARVTAVALAKSPERRNVAIVSCETADERALAKIEGVSVYRPMAPPAKLKN
jgi:hypothetical protein